jgi:multidrug transporter EmrE-like cation transporter
VAYVFVAGTVLFSVYGQLVFKWQVDQAGGIPSGTSGRIQYFFDLAMRPWMISAMLLIGVAALCWIAAIDKLDLSRAYPFVSASFILVLLASAIFFGEAITVPKVVGASLIVLGLIVGSQG